RAAQRGGPQRGGAIGSWLVTLREFQASRAVFREHRAVDFNAEPRARRNFNPARRRLDRPGDELHAERMRGAIELEDRFPGEERKGAKGEWCATGRAAKSCSEAAWAIAEPQTCGLTSTPWDCAMATMCRAAEMP